MTVLKGRRRIGKTTLGILSMEGTDTVYLFVARKAEADLCSEYAETIRQTLKRICPTRNLSFQGHIRNADEYRQASIIQSVH